MKSSTAEIIEELTPQQVLTDSPGNRDIEKQVDYAGEKTVLFQDCAENIESAWLKNNKTEEWIHLQEFPFVIGRNESANLTIFNRGISRQHAIITLMDGRLVIEDTASLNGIKVNGHKVRKMLLDDEDTIRLGNATYTFHHRRHEISTIEVSNNGNPDISRRSVMELQNTGIKNNLPPLKYIISGLIFFVASIITIYSLSVTSRVVEVSQEKHSTVKDIVKTPVSNGKIIDIQVSKGEYNQSNENQEELPGTSINDVSIIKKQHKIINSTSAISSKIRKFVSREKSEQEISRNLGEYRKGNVEKALQGLRKMSISKMHIREQKTRAKILANEISGIYKYYKDGSDAFIQGSKKEGFKAWHQFLLGEKKLGLHEKSVYAREVMIKVVSEYENMANKAQEEKRWHDSYRYWRRAVEIDPEGSAAKSLDAIEQKAKSVYREGYRLETVNLERAKTEWRNVLEIVPPSSKYHAKASAKLSWYEHLGK